MDPYRVLDVSPTATHQEIKQAFRRQARLLHPDSNPDQTDEEAQDFKDLVASYEVLSDEKRRASYDAGEYNLDNHEFAVQAEALSLDDLFASLFNERSDAKKDDLFDFSALRELGKNKGKRRKKKPSQANKDFRVKVRIPAEAAEKGSTVAVDVSQIGVETDRIKVRIPTGTEHGQLLGVKIGDQKIIIEVLIDS